MMQNHLKLHPLSAMLLCIFTTGATWAQEAKNTENPKAPVTELSAITAETPKERTAFDPVIGYVATRSASATRTDTPINEIPQSISVIGAQQIKDQGSRSLSDAIRYSPGVSANFYGANSSREWFQMRGSSARVFEDGLAEKADNGDRSDVPIEPFAYERIETIRGSNAIIAGNNYAGGAINLVSKRPQADPYRELSLSYGSHNFKKITADFTGNLDKESKWLYRFIAVAHDSDTQVDHTKLKRILIRPMLTWKPDDATELTLYADYQRDNNTLQNYFPTSGTLLDRPIGKIPMNRFFGERDWERGRGSRKRIGWEFSKKFNDNWQLKHHFRYANSDRLFKTIYPIYWIDDVFYNANGVPNPNYGEYMRRGAELQIEKRNAYSTDILIEGKFNTGILKHNALLALDMSYIHGGSGSFEKEVSLLNVYKPIYGNYTYPDIPNIPLTSNKLKAYGITLQDQIKIADSLVLTGSARYDLAHAKQNNISETNHRISPRLGVVWLAGRGFSPYLSYSESFQNLFNVRMYNGGLAKPLIAKQLEAGIRWQSASKNILLSAAVYKSKEKNNVTSDPKHPGFVEQLGEVTRKGIELEAGFNLNNWDIISQYTYNRNYITKTDIGRANRIGAQISFTPKHAASLWVLHKFDHLGIPNLRVGAGITYKGTTEDGVKNGIKLPAVTTLDMMVSYNKGPLSLSLNINNLTDKKSLTYCEARFCTYNYRRNIVGNIAYKW